MSEIHLFGIRHHGPGSARSLLHALETTQPDIVLIEGPPDADGLLPLAAHAGLAPPIALLVYVADAPARAVMYPFASFSPEWQAIQYALARQVPVRFIDLPQSVRLAMPEADDAVAESKLEPADAESRASEPSGLESESPAEPDSDSEPAANEDVHNDPLTPMALAAGHADTERWWDQLVESRAGHDLEVFQAIHEMMGEIRAATQQTPSLYEQRREAHMRKCIRTARSESYQRIAVVCGAYHTPALAEFPPAKHDDALLKGLEKCKTAAAWVPWSYERLSYRSGYGAGIESPVWYELLWERLPALGAQWLTRAARLLREADVPISSAHVIEACRLAEALAAVRGHSLPTLGEYNDAAIAVLGSGNALNLEMIRQRWYFAARLGQVPEEFPGAPLQKDLAALQKRLRFPPKAEDKTFDFDLRQPMDRERSQVLRRLRLLGIEWGVPGQRSGGRGTFHEIWQVCWKPEFAIGLIEASRFGHTIEQAASMFVVERASTADATLGSLIALLEDALFAELGTAIESLVHAIDARAATSMDALQLLDALPPLIEVHRYGDVRQTDVSLIGSILHGLVPRIFIAVPQAVSNVDDEAAKLLWQKLVAADRALSILGNEEFGAGWRETLLRVAQSEATHPLLSGYAHRVLYDATALEFEDLERAFALTLSPGNEPVLAAAWAEGLLSGSGAVLLHDDRLRSLLDGWVRSVTEEHFVQVLPLLRRTFAQFPAAERRQLGGRLRADLHPEAAPAQVGATDFDEAAARAVLPLLQLIWNVGGNQ
jgi:hypothetical protein